MFFKFGKSALYERLLKEKDRQIDILAEQIDYLRMQLAIRGDAVSKPIQLPTHDPAMPDLAASTYVSDEELDAEALVESGAIKESDVQGILEELGLSGDIKLDI